MAYAILDELPMITTPHLLIVDDDRAFRETLQSAFVSPGFETTLAADGEHAVEIVATHNIHVVLMDFQMPRLSGIEALRQVKEQQEELPCILISGAIDETVLEQAKELAIYNVMPKPIKLAEIRMSVRDALAEFYGWTDE